MNMHGERGRGWEVKDLSPGIRCGKIYRPYYESTTIMLL